MNLRWIAGFGVLVSAVAHAQFAPNAKYVQFRAMAGLPGAGVAVDEAGTPGFKGALTYNTPVAYSLGRLKVALAAGSLSRDKTLRWFGGEGGEVESGNGTFSGLLGYNVERYRFTGGVTVISSDGDHVFNLHGEVPGHIPLDYYEEVTAAFGFGVQDILGDGGYSRAGHTDDRRSSTSLYGVATVKYRTDVYGSLGWGTGRFKQGFASASYGFNDWSKAFVEYDGYGWTYGIGLGYENAIGTVGFSNGNRAFFTLGLGF